MQASVYDPQNINNDAFDRANHTGTQAISTVSGLETALDDSVIPQFVTKADAEAFTPTGTDPDYIRFLSDTGLDPSNGGQDWLGRKVGVEPSHANWIRNRSGSGSYYERVPAAPRVPAGLWEFGNEGKPNQGASVNATVALNKLLTAAANSGFKSYQFPAGQMYFNTRPNDITVEGLELYGPGMRNTNAYYKNFESSGTNDGIFNFRRDNFKFRDFRFVGIEASQSSIDNRGTGCFFSVVAASGMTAAYFEIDDIECTSDASLPNGHACVYTNFILDGIAGSIPGYSVRAAYMRGLKLFGAEVAALIAKNCSSIEIAGQGTFTAGGLTGKVILSGTATHPGTGCLIDFVRIHDGLNAYYCDYHTVRAAKWNGGTITIGATASHLMVEGTTRLVTFANNSISSTIRNQFGVVGQHTVTGTATGIGMSYTTVNFPAGVTFASAPIVIANVIGAASGGIGLDIGTIGTSSFTAAVASGTEDIVWIAVGTRAS